MPVLKHKYQYCSKGWEITIDIMLMTFAFYIYFEKWAIFLKILFDCTFFVFEYVCLFELNLKLLF